MALIMGRRGVFTMPQSEDTARPVALGKKQVKA
jgi:hypothetical protein